MLKFVLVVAVFAALVYALMWALERRRFGDPEAPPSKPRRAPRPQRRQTAPDDDEDFLRGLGRQGRNDSPE